MNILVVQFMALQDEIDYLLHVNKIFESRFR